jgi:EAL domain-containing protein (putative c-di-GMP-specific phosphodiesterase class I)
MMEPHPAGTGMAGSKPPPLGEWVAEVDLHSALAEFRIATCYQPIVRMCDRRPVGLEVLARLDHPSRGMLGADLFIPPMEDAGLAWPLTQAVARRAFADWGGGVLDKLDVTLALNISLDVLLCADALVELDHARADAGIAADRIVLELTESRPLKCLNRLGMVTSSLRRIGYGLAIDDVGPGVRDHSALLDLDFTAMKLDKELVQLATRDQGARDYMMRAIAAARRSGLHIVAEGVEDAATWAEMRDCGADHAQGYFISHPLPAAALDSWWDAWCGGGG